LASTLAKSTAMSAALGFLGFMFILFMSSIPRLGRFLPGNLMNRSLSLTAGDFYPEFAANITVSLALTAALLGLAIIVLKRQEL
jgi:hypothetical protein